MNFACDLCKCEFRTEWIREAHRVSFKRAQLASNGLSHHSNKSIGDFTFYDIPK